MNGVSRPNGSVPPRGWVLYDGECGVCRSLASRVGPSLVVRGFGLAPLQADWVRAALQLDEPALLRDVRLLQTDGPVIGGADVYRHILRAFWWGRPIAWASTLPVLGWIFDGTYRLVADHRDVVSRTCGIERKRGTGNDER